MTWSSERPPMPEGWDLIRDQILADNDICYVCGRPGSDSVDHLKPRYRGGSEAESNLAPIHSKPCHSKKSSAEGHARKRELRSQRKRPPERHPGST